MFHCFSQYKNGMRSMSYAGLGVALLASRLHTPCWERTQQLLCSNEVVRASQSLQSNSWLRCSCRYAAFGILNGTEPNPEFLQRMTLPPCACWLVACSIPDCSVNLHRNARM